MSKTKHYYVYLLERKDGTAKYVGSRGSTLPPKEDFGNAYFSSGTLKDAFHKTPDDFTYRILSEHATRDEAFVAERTCISMMKDDPTCVNGPYTLEEDEAWEKKEKKKRAKATRKVSAAEEQRYKRVAKALVGAPGYERGTAAWLMALRERKYRDVAKLAGITLTHLMLTYVNNIDNMPPDPDFDKHVRKAQAELLGAELLGLDDMPQNVGLY